MSYLLSKSQKQGQIQHITPENADWEYVGFEAYLLNAGEELALSSEQNELCLVFVAGKANVLTSAQTFSDIGNRTTPFEKNSALCALCAASPNRQSGGDNRVGIGGLPRAEQR